jgi:hypothetical protein
MKINVGCSASRWVVRFGTVALTVFSALWGRPAICRAADDVAALVIAECSTSRAATCAAFPRASGGHAEVELIDQRLTFVDARRMGRYDINGAVHRLAYVFTAATSPRVSSAWLFVIDLATEKKIAWARTPPGYGVDDTYFDYVRAPGGQERPFIAPGAHYLAPDAANPTGSFIAPPWNYLCIFDPNKIVHPDPGCGTGFRRASISFTTREGVNDVNASGFRHGGGWVEDVDGDGWDDINLPFLRYILTISGRTGKQLALSHFDVAAQSEPQYPSYFHSGRFYGRFTTFVEPGTRQHDVLFTDGEAAGSFGGLYCGVSRYVAVAQWRPGPSLRLKWSDYLSFAKTIFKRPFASTMDVVRRGDDLNKCPHFFGNGREWLNGRPLVMFSLFEEDHPSPARQTELLAEQREHFAPAASEAYERLCAPKHIPSATGTWSVHILDAVTGRELSVLPRAYVWGKAANVVPGKPPLFLVQPFPAKGGKVAYDRTDDHPAVLSLMQLGRGPALAPVATIDGPLPPPVVTGVLDWGQHGNMGGGPAYPPGIGSSYEGISQLVVKASGRNALNDIRLKNGAWLGYSDKRRSLVIKTSI